MTESIIIREWGKCELSEVQLTANDRHLLKILEKRGYLSLRELKNKTEIKANRYAGVIQLEKSTLYINPKIGSQLLLQMIDYGLGLNVLKIYAQCITRI